MPGHAVGVGGEELPQRPHGCSSIGYDEGLELLDQLGAAGLGEAGADADVLQLPTVVQTEEEAAEQRPLRSAGLVLAVARDDDVRGALVLDLEHGAGVLDVRRAQRLGDDAVEPGTLELVEPPSALAGSVVVAGEEARAVEAARAPPPARRDARRTAGRRTTSSPRASRSKATKPAGVFSASMSIAARRGGSAPGGSRTPAGRRRYRRAARRRSRRRGHTRRAAGQHRLDHLGEVAGQRLGVAAAPARPRRRP